MNTTLCVLITIVGWSICHLAMKQSTRSMHPLAIQFVACLCSTITMPIYYYLMRKNHVAKFNLAGVGWGSLAYFATAIGTLAYITALSQKEISSVVGLVNIYPIIIAVVAVAFMGETFTIPKFAGLFLIVVGVFVSSRG